MSDLISPGDIIFADAADAEDLLQQLKEVNMEKVDDKLQLRSAQKMKIDRETEIFDWYLEKAKNYYVGLWAMCRNSKVGHDFNNLDVKGTTIRVCETCGYPAATPGDLNARSSTYGERTTEEYKDDLFRNLAKQLIKLDVEAGVVETPKVEDFLGVSDNGNGGKPRFNFKIR